MSLVFSLWDLLRIIRAIFGKDLGGDHDRISPKLKPDPTAAPQLLIELLVKESKFWEKANTNGVHEVVGKLVVGHLALYQLKSSH